MIAVEIPQGADETTRQVLGIGSFLKRVEPHSAAAKAHLADLARAPFLPPSVWRVEMERVRGLDEAVDEAMLQALGIALGELPTLERPFRRLDAGEALVEGELFEIKRFLFYGLIVLNTADGLDGLASKDSALVEHLQGLMGAIHPERVATARFYLADELDEALAQGRARLGGVQRELRRRRQELEEEVLARERGRFDLRGRFIPADGASGLQDPRLIYRDGAYWLDDEGLIALAREEEELSRSVERVEGEVRRRLSDIVARSRAELEALAEQFCQTDLRLARVKLRRRLRGCWPQELDEERSGELLMMEGAWSPELVDELGEEAVQAIDLTLDEGATLVVGPNMGGKSALLRLIGLLQWCAQMGLPIPARRFYFRHVSKVIYVGAEEPLAREGQAGLSSFGREVSRFVEFWEQEGPLLWLLDEPARGTHPEEGAYLAGQIIDERLVRGDRLVITTHFPQLANQPGYGRRRIEGLKVEDEVLSKALQRARVEGRDLHRVLAQFMDYRVRSVEEGVVPRDAEKVARALGLRLSR